MNKFNKWDDYLYPNTDILKNKHGIKNQDELNDIEYSLSELSASERKEFEVSPEGLKDIHKHLLGDTYEWAGENRVTGMSGYGMNFAPPENIDAALKEAFKPLGKNGENLKDTSIDEFAEKMADNIGYLNAIHPFREGNGRAMKYHLENSAKVAGFELDASTISKELWNNATGDAAEHLDNNLLKATIVKAIKDTQDQNEKEKTQPQQYYNYQKDNSKEFVKKINEVSKTYKNKSLSEQVGLDAALLDDFAKLTPEEKANLPENARKVGEKLDKKQKQIDKIKQDHFELKKTPHIPEYKKTKEEKNIAEQFNKLDKKQRLALQKQDAKVAKSINKIHKKHLGKSRDLQKHNY